MGRTRVSVGDKFGRLTVQKRSAETDADGRIFWVCLCSCGTLVPSVRGDSLKSKKTQSCGCLRVERHRDKMAPRLEGLVIAGRRVVGLSEKRSTKPGQEWRVGCLKCGKRATVTTYALRRDHPAGCASCTKLDETPLRFVHTRLIWTAKRRGLDAPITLEELTEVARVKECHYCGEELFWPRSKHEGYQTNLDRKNNALGYTKENVVPCCGDCNFLKGSRFSYEEFLLIAKSLRKIKATRLRATSILLPN